MSPRLAPSFVSFWLFCSSACANSDLVWRDSSVPPSAAGTKAEGGEGSDTPRSGADGGGLAPEGGRAGAGGSPAAPFAAGASATSAGASALGGTEVGGSPGASGAADSDGGSAAGGPGEVEACPPGCCAPTAFQANDEPSVGSLLADSREGFSDVQGQCGWTYGYLPSGAEPFTLLSHFIASPTPMWRVSTSTPPWSTIYREKQHPNQVPLQWIARRWTSPVRGALSVKGHAAKADSGGNGVTALVRVDGVTVWEERVDDSVARDFALQVDAVVGTTIDLIIAPRGGDAHDSTELTAFISW
jgi:hypothetical protein